jgi:hypothetical protein
MRHFGRFSNRPVGVKRFQTIHHYSVEVTPCDAKGHFRILGAAPASKGCFKLTSGNRLSLIPVQPWAPMPGGRKPKPPICRRQDPGLSLERPAPGAMLEKLSIHA